ncbi:MAG: HD-GYP domain-containing protein [Actinomycetota bacterium]
MPPRSRSKRAGFVVAAVSLTALASSAGAITWWGTREGWATASLTTAVAFVAFVAIGDLLEIPLERRSVFSLGLAPALAFALLNGPHLGEAIVVFLAGNVVAVLVRGLRRQDLRLPETATRTLVVLAAGGIYRAVFSAVPSLLTFGPEGHQMSGVGLLAVLFTVVLLDVAFQSALTLADEQLAPVRVVRDQLRSTGTLLLSTVSVGALLALAYPALEVWTLPLFLAPLAATQYSFKQVASIRKNYLQTIRALSKVPEMAGYTVRGHSSRVARLSVEIAQELGIGDPLLHEIEYAALLHDIGRISLPDPEEAAQSTSRLELALVGSEIVENTGHFPEVAAMVRQQHEPYRRRGEDANPDLMIGAKIVKVASAFDDLTEPSGPGRTAWDALERLHLGMAYEYDPAVIQALTRVLELHGSI